jgi:hypothetical protein
MDTKTNDNFATWRDDDDGEKRDGHQFLGSDPPRFGSGAATGQTDPEPEERSGSPSKKTDNEIRDFFQDWKRINGNAAHAESATEIEPYHVVPRRPGEDGGISYRECCAGFRVSTLRTLEPPDEDRCS